MEEIIIDGVDVSGCKMRTENNEMLCMLVCKYNPNCYYKQFKRLQAENEELKAKYEEVANENLKEIYELIKKNDVWRGIVSVVNGKIEQENTELKKENELIKRLLNDILKIFNLGQYDFLKDQNEIIMALEKAIQRDKDFFEFVGFKQENERLKSKLKSQQMINLKQQDIAQDYWNALEEIKKIVDEETNTDKLLHYKELSHYKNYCAILDIIQEVLK